VQSFYHLALPKAADGGRPAITVGDVVSGVQGDIRDDALLQLLVGSSIALGIMVVLSVGAGWLLAGRALRPMGRLTERAQRLSETNLHERIALDGPQDELWELAATLDGMLDRLEAAFTTQRRFAADVSHELRTPLAIVRAEADLALGRPGVGADTRHLAHSVIDAATRSEALLDSLLALSRSESTMNDHDVVDLADLVGDVVNDRIGAADAAAVHVDLELEDASVEGDRFLLERLVANLVDNGINHNTSGGWLQVSVGRRNGSSVLHLSTRVTCSPRTRSPTSSSRSTGPPTAPGPATASATILAVGGARPRRLARRAPAPEGGLDIVVESCPQSSRPGEPRSARRTRAGA
jgi:signal transduction histidine kinase